MRIATVGDNCMDVYSRLGQAFPGGNPVNVAVYLLRLGMEASYTGVVGTDPNGALMKSALAAKGVDISHLHTRRGRTAVTQVELVDGERLFGDYDEGVMADFRLSPEDIDFICRHNLLHTGLWGKIHDQLPELKRHRVRVSFDFADKLDHPIINQALPWVDYAFFAYSRDDDFIRDYLRQAQAKGPRLAVATLGGNGSLAYDGTRFTPHGIVPVEVVDTMGAGDSFIAGFLRGLLLGKNLEECLDLGAANASETLKYRGAWELQPDQKTTPDVAAIGDNCFDVYPVLGREYPTGNAVDFAVNIHRLGYPTALVSVTGDDERGRVMHETLAREGLDLSHLHTGHGATAVTMMDMHGKDRVHGEYVEGVLEQMQFTPADLEFASRHTLVHTAFWGRAEAHLEKLRAHGALISFDYANKKDDLLVDRSLPFVDYAFFSFPHDLEAARKFLSGVCTRGPQVAVTTFGAQGSLAFDGGQYYSFGIFPAEVENTVGAGDAFIAGFMGGVLAGAGIQDCLERGARVAAEVVETFEPWVKRS
jgi:fructoselysine 6-kinase